MNDSEKQALSDNGFVVLRVRADAPLYAVIQRWSPELERSLAESGATHLVISNRFDDEPSALRRLARFAGPIEYLRIPSTSKVDLGFISDLINLRELDTEQLTDAPSFSALTRLEVCYLSKPAGLGRLHEAPALRTLSMWGVKLDSLEPLGEFPALRELTLRQVDSLETLDGIETVPLEKLQLEYNRRLKSVSALRGMRSLRTLRQGGSSGIVDFDQVGDWPALQHYGMQSGPPLPGFDFLTASSDLRSFGVASTNMAVPSCSIAPFTHMPRLDSFYLYAGPTKGFRCIRDIERLGEIPSLTFLKLSRGPELPNLGFLRSLPELRTLEIVSTPILDGDLTPILGLSKLARLLVYPDRKHYSHKFEELVREWNALHRSSKSQLVS